MPHNRLSTYFIIVSTFLSSSLLAKPLCEVQWGPAKVEKACLIEKAAANEPSGILIKGFKWAFNRETISLKMTLKNPENLSGFKLSFLRRGKVEASYTLPLYTDPEYNIFQDGVETWLSIPVSSLDWVEKKPEGKDLEFNGLTLYLAHNQRTQNPLGINIAAFKNQGKPQKGFVSITFDDGYYSNYIAAKIMAPFQLKGTAYLIAKSLGTKGYLTNKELKEMKAWGWSFGTHLTTPVTQQSDLQKTIKEAKEKILRLGSLKEASHFALPLGKYNQQTLETLKKEFKTIRLAGGGFESLPLTDTSRLKTINVTKKMGPQEIVTMCQKAITNGDWAILMFHYLDRPEKGDLSYPSDKFKELSRLLAPFQSQIKPVDHIYAK